MHVPLDGCIYTKVVEVCTKMVKIRVSIYRYCSIGLKFMPVERNHRLTVTGRRRPDFINDSSTVQILARGLEDSQTIKLRVGQADAKCVT